MFGLFKTEDFQHPTLGTFKWVRGCWRGEASIPGGKVAPLIVGGTRKGPDQQALNHAVNLDRDLQSVAPQLKQALFEHYEPYAEAVREGELKVEDGTFPRVQNGAAALSLAEVEAVLVVELDGALATEVCYRVPWDEEHTLGARFRGPDWVELCGSTLVP
jgi:hypothetical protein